METNRVNQHLVGSKYEDILPKLSIFEDQGDCCGYASCEEQFTLPLDTDIAKLVLKDCVQIDYNEDYDGSRSVVNFVFTDGEGEWILGYKLSAGSGSGWGYGAYVQLKLGDEVLAEESW